MARLWRDSEADDLLAPVSGWLAEGFDMLDLKEARAYWTNWRSEGER